MKEKLKIKTITKTTSACPTQWEGKLEDGRLLYIRYRFGRLSVRVHESDPVCKGETVYERQGLDELDGVMSYESLKEELDNYFIFPPEESQTKRFI